jgi:hypothetical protein
VSETNPEDLAPVRRTYVLEFDDAQAAAEFEAAISRGFKKSHILIPVKRRGAGWNNVVRCYARLIDQVLG